MCTFEHGDAKMQCVVDLAGGSSLDFWIVLCHGIDMIVYSVMGHNLVVIPSCGTLGVLLMKELHCTPLAAYPGVHKTVDIAVCSVMVAMSPYFIG